MGLQRKRYSYSCKDSKEQIMLQSMCNHVCEMIVSVCLKKKKKSFNIFRNKCLKVVFPSLLRFGSLSDANLR